MVTDTKEDRVVLITGCSTGIGRDLAVRMSARGYKVVATARRLETLDRLEAAMMLPLDVTSDESVTAAVRIVHERFGRLDVLINNAGFSTEAAIEELTDESLRAMLEVNVLGAMRMLRAVAPLMRARGRGTIVNISSLVGRMSMPVNGGYAATKYAMEALSDAARQELGSFGVDVVVVEPGSIRTRFADAMIARSAAVLENTTSPYHRLYTQNAALTEQLRSSEAAPSEVSMVVLTALGARRPKARYTAAIPLTARLMFQIGPRLRDRLWRLALERAGVRALASRIEKGTTFESA